MAINTTSLMLNKDGSAYHLHTFPGEIAPIVIFVGDPARVNQVVQYFDSIELQRTHREFVVVTGRIGKQRLTVIATGISTSNIDIVLNELDMLINYDFDTQSWRDSPISLDIIRLGSSGALQAGIPVGSFIISEYAFALDGLLNYYQFQNDEEEQKYLDAIYSHFSSFAMRESLYLARANKVLFDQLKFLGSPGITFTCCGFYGPQYRKLRAPLIDKDILQIANQFKYKKERITNFEMETAAIYGLGEVLGHRCCSINAIVANRIRDEVHPQPTLVIDDMIKKFMSSSVITER